MLSLFGVIIRSLVVDTHLWRGASAPYSAGTPRGYLMYLVTLSLNLFN